jgi:hypothetical protein
MYIFRKNHNLYIIVHFIKSLLINDSHDNWVTVPNNLINNVGERGCLIFWRNNISLFGKLSVRQNVFSAKCRSAKCLIGKCMTTRYFSFWICHFVKKGRKKRNEIYHRPAKIIIGILLIYIIYKVGICYCAFSKLQFNIKFYLGRFIKYSAQGRR